MGATDAPDGVGNYWTSLPDWPAAVATPLYLSPGGLLSWQPPSAPTPSGTAEAGTMPARGARAAAGVNATTDADQCTSWAYDPTSPSATIGGNNLILPCGPLDQRPVEAKADVAVFTTPALPKALALTGALEATLYVSSANANDTDFHLRLTDVYPDGTSRLIQDGIQRMRWRAGVAATTPTLMTPGEVYEISVCLWNTSYVFAPGHRIRLVVGSANAPRFRPNPNTGRLLVDEDGRSVIAQNSVHHSALRPSSIALPVVQLSQMPRHRILDSLASTAAAPGAQAAHGGNASHIALLKALLKAPGHQAGRPTSP
jgi:putative CocE/NonD family hydrolase